MKHLKLLYFPSPFRFLQSSISSKRSRVFSPNLTGQTSVGSACLREMSQFSQVKRFQDLKAQKEALIVEAVRSLDYRVFTTSDWLNRLLFVLQKGEDTDLVTATLLIAQRMVTRLFNLHDNSWKLNSIEDWMNAHGTTVCVLSLQRGPWNFAKWAAVMGFCLDSKVLWWRLQAISMLNKAGGTPKNITIFEVQAFGTIPIDTYYVYIYTVYIYISYRYHRYIIVTVCFSIFVLSLWRVSNGVPLLSRPGRHQGPVPSLLRRPGRYEKSGGAGWVGSWVKKTWEATAGWYGNGKANSYACKVP